VNVQLPLAVGLSPGQPAITPLDPADDAPGAFAEMLGALQDGTDVDPAVGVETMPPPIGGDLAEPTELSDHPDPGGLADEPSLGAPVLDGLPLLEGAMGDAAEAPESITDAPAGLLMQAAGAPTVEALGSTLGAAGRAARAAVPPVPTAAAPHAAAQAEAVLVDAGRAGVSPAPELALAPEPSAASGSARTLDAAPWFAVRAGGGAEARGQALARAVQPALKDATPLATREAQGAARGNSATLSGTATSLGTMADVQAMVDGELAVRAPDLVARAVSHNVARGAMLQAQRAQVDLPQRVLAEATSSTAPAPLSAEPTVAAADSAPPQDAAPTPDAPRPVATSPGAARTATSAPVAPLVAEVPLGIEAPAAPTALDAAAATARGATASASAASDAALAAGRPTEAQLGQVAVPDADHMELKVSDGEHSFRLSIAREADGLNVELKAPREIVADLRALEPDVEAALAEDGYELASFDAHADDSQSDGSAGEDGGHPANEPGNVADGAQGEAEPVPVAPTGQGHLVNRLA
jgi:hypothetical protein